MGGVEYRYDKPSYDPLGRTWGDHSRPSGVSVTNDDVLSLGRGPIGDVEVNKILEAERRRSLGLDFFRPIRKTSQEDRDRFVQNLWDVNVTNAPVHRSDTDRSALPDYYDALAAAQDKAEADARARFGSLPAGRTQAHTDAINEALELLADVQGNEAALGDVYDQYDEVVNPFVEEALAAADGISEEMQAIIRETFGDRERVIRNAYSNAEQTVMDVAALTDAGEHAAAAAVAEIDGQELELAHAAAEAESWQALADLEEIVFEKEAIARRARDRGQISREEKLQMVWFEDQEEQAEDYLKSAREAAARAAAARKRAIAARNEAIRKAREEAAVASVLGAGAFSAEQQLYESFGHVREDRFEYLAAKAENAIQNRVPARADAVAQWFEGQDLSPEEIYGLADVLDAHEDGLENEWRKQGGEPTPRSSDYRPQVS